ncbi:cyclase family protein [candidate division GN15 bacterium]|nr:cyclase family protein [candidate division GN15 bacterium]
MTHDWIDISVPLTGDLPVWPGDGPVEIRRQVSMAEGHDANLTRINMSAHTGTHLDAPLHFLPDGAAIDAIPPSVMIGTARVLAFPGVPAVTADHLSEHAITAGERLLLRTDNSNHAWYSQPFNPDFVHLATDAAAWLAERKVDMIGIDYLSVAGFQRNELEVHRALLGAGVWILEGLDLSGVEPGRYELACLPLHLVGADGAPARALVRQRVEE